MSKLFEQINKERMETTLGKIAFYVNEKIDISDVSLGDYISTENMVSNRGGVVLANKLPKGKVTKFKNGDVLTSNIRPYFKKIWFASKEGGASNDVLVIRPKNETELDNLYLYHILSNDLFFSYSVASSHGTKMPRGDKDAIIQYKITLPPLSVQKKIASILGAYDEKIENNNKIIKNLEETAQTIFNEWFVNFKFPGYEKVKMVDSETGEIPEGWEVKDLNDIANITFGFNFKSKLFNENGIGVPVVRIRDVLSGITQTFSPEIPSAEYEIKSGDLLIGMDGIFHCAFWYNDGYFLNQRVVCIRSDFPGYFIYESIRDQLDFLQKTIIGATVGHLSNGDIRSFKILIPKDKSLLKVFKDITNKILSLKKENISLKSQRDLLLSKLI